MINKSNKKKSDRHCPNCKDYKKIGNTACEGCCGRK